MIEQDFPQEDYSIDVSNDNHPLARIKFFFTNRNNSFFSVGALLCISYFIFTFLSVQKSLYNAGGVVRHNQSLAKEYYDVKHDNSMILVKLDSLGRNRFDKVLLDSIRTLRDSTSYYQKAIVDLRKDMDILNQKFKASKSELELVHSDLQQKNSYISQLKSQDNYNTTFYNSLSHVNDSLSLTNYKLKSKLKSLQEQLNATAIQGER